MRFLLFIAVTMMSLAFPVAAKAAGSSGCDAICEAQQQSVGQGKISSTVDTGCFYLEQEGTQAVPMFIRNGTGVLINASSADPSIPQANHRKQKGSSDSYCPGQHYLEEALSTGGWVEFCNDGWSSNRIEGEALRKHIDAGNAPQTQGTTVCLMNADDCDQRLVDYQVPG